nr:iaa-amino acid hydrolase ilr1-like 5 [Quercus suber]
MKEEDYPLLPAVMNHEKLHLHVQKVGKLLLGPQNVKVGVKMMAGHSLHSPYFFLDEDILPTGAALHTSLAEIYLSEHQHSLMP